MGNVDRLAHGVLAALAKAQAAPEDALYALAEAQRLLAIRALQHVGWTWMDAASVADNLAFVLARLVLDMVRREYDGLLPAEVLAEAAGDAMGETEGQ